MNIGIVGNGFVGGAVANGVGNSFGVKVYDKDINRSTHNYDDVIHCDFVFVCLPTPMTSVEGGVCNLSAIEDFFSTLPQDCRGTFIIKSTVPVGTTDRLCKEHPHLKIVHNPEFLTAANANEDFLNADRHIVGGDVELVLPVVEMYKKLYPDIPVYTMKSKESECVKYFANCFLASKLMVFNEMKLLCESLKDVNYETIIEGVVSDRRIGNSHCYVPGPDGEYGFGGTCFPKDINALIRTMEENGINPRVLSSVWEQNKQVRLNWDWADNESAVRMMKQ